MENEYVAGILDNDVYKFTMQCGACQKYPNALAMYQFINRDGREFPDGFADELRRIIDTFRGFTLSKDDIDFLKEKCYYLNPAYIDLLSGYRYNPDEIILTQEGSNFHCKYIGPWYRKILWEVPLMATISQLYFEKTGKTKMIRKERKERNRLKFMALKEIGVPIAEFGTRRRYSLKNHDEVVRDAKQYLGSCFSGPSNVYLAKKYNLTPIGTKAHEWYQFHAAMYGFRMANEMALKIWSDIFQGDLGIALPDTFTTDVFLKTFNTFFAKLFDGLRQDSGSPFDFITKSVSKYQKLRIDPMLKTLVFSDAINSIDKVKSIHKACINLIRDAYGIGTWFTNDVDVIPLNIVIKMIACMINGRWIDTVKLSDDEGKNTGNKDMIVHCKKDLMI